MTLATRLAAVERATRPRLPIEPVNLLDPPPPPILAAEAAYLAALRTGDGHDLALTRALQICDAGPGTETANRERD